MTDVLLYAPSDASYHVNYRQVPFALPDTGLAEADAAKQVLLDGWLTTGHLCGQFEEAFAAQVGAAYAVAVNSGTAALHLALEAVGVSRGDIVVTTPYTFAASAEVIRYLDALPVFVDVEASTFNLDCAKVEDLLARLEGGDPDALPPAVRHSFEPARPKAMIPVHVGGVPCELERLTKVAKSYDVAVVEDAAHAFPSAIGSRPVGSFTTGAGAACFSFYATKTLTTGEGGMLVTDDPEIAARARQMSLHGLSRDAWARRQGESPWHYDIVAPGFKYNLTDVAAAVGLVQLSRTQEMMDKRAAIARRYEELLGSVGALEIPVVAAGVSSSWHLYMLRLRLDRLRIGRGQFVKELAARGVATSVHFIPLHLHSYYRTTLGYRPDDFPVAVAQYEREISLPIYSRMSEDDVEHVGQAVTDVANRFCS